jgi:hypothetical protein
MSEGPSAISGMQNTSGCLSIACGKTFMGVSPAAALNFMPDSTFSTSGSGLATSWMVM